MMKSDDWTKITEDNKPEIGKPYLLFIDLKKDFKDDEDKKKQVGKRFSGDTYVIGGMFSFDIGTVTHYQELPGDPEN